MVEIFGEAEQMEVIGEAEQTEATGKAEQTEATGEAEQMEATGEAEQMEATGEAEQTEATGEAEQTEAAGEEEQTEAAGEEEQTEAAGEEGQVVIVGDEAYTPEVIAKFRKEISENPNNRGRAYLTTFKEGDRRAEELLREEKLCARTWTIVQDLKHKETKEELWSVDDIKKGLACLPQIKEFAYIIHDQDVYTKADQDRDSSHKLNTLKNPHVHLVFRTYAKGEVANKAPKLSLKKVSWMFNVAPNACGKVEGKKGFLNMCRYLVHETSVSIEEGKTHYEDNCVISNFKFRDFIETELSVGRHTQTEKYLKRLAIDGESLEKIKTENPWWYAGHRKEAENAVKFYNRRTGPKPEHRVVVFFYGDGGAGKSVIVSEIAKALGTKTLEDEGKKKDDRGFYDDDDLFCAVGEGSVSFQSYYGQPVLEFDDARARKILANKVIGDANGFLRMIEPHPRFFEDISVKYGSVKLIEKYILINSSETYQEFFELIMAAERSKKQMSRRLPIIVRFEKNEADRSQSCFYIGRNQKIFGLSRDSNIITFDRRVMFDADNLQDFRYEAERRGEVEKFRQKIAVLIQPILDAISEVEEIYNKGGRELSDDEYDELDKSLGVLEVLGDEAMSVEIFGNPGEKMDTVAQERWARIFLEAKKPLQDLTGADYRRILTEVLVRERESDCYWKALVEKSFDFKTVAEYNHVIECLRTRCRKRFGEDSL